MSVFLSLMQIALVGMAACAALAGHWDWAIGCWLAAAYCWWHRSQREHAKAVGPRIGDVVTYTLSAADAQQINARRRTAAQLQDTILAGAWTVGAQAHMGSTVAAGDRFGAIVVRVGEGDVINAQVMLDGTDVHWTRAARRGAPELQGCWQPMGQGMFHGRGTRRRA